MPRLRRSLQNSVMMVHLQNTSKTDKKIINSKYAHTVNSNIDIVTNIQPVDYNLYIVYYINCLVNPNYFNWLYNQINLVKSYNATIYIMATLSEEKEEIFKIECLSHFPKVKIQCNYTNQYEYPGILKVWELGQIYNKPNDIILYFHAKGLTHHQNYESNANDNYNIILKDIHKIYDIFTTFPTIDKIGYSCSKTGWIWYNFWYARGSYIFNVEKPLQTQRRHYYEDWLGRKITVGDQIVNEERPSEYYENTLKSCYSFYSDATHGNIGSYYCPQSNKHFK